MARIGDLTSSDGLYIADIIPTSRKTIISHDIKDFGPIYYDMGSRGRSLSVNVVLAPPDGSSADTLYQKLQSYERRKEPVVLDDTDTWASYGFMIGTISGVTAPMPGGVNFYLEISFKFQPLLPWGTMFFNTGDHMKARDLTWKGNLKIADPTIGYHNFTYDAATKTFTAEIIVFNTHTSAEEAWLEFCLPDNIDKFHIDSWDGSAWQRFLNHTTDTYDSGKLYYLDGQTATTKWGAGNGAAMYAFGDRGTTVSVLFGEAKGDKAISVRSATIKRVLAYVKFPAKTAASLASAPYAVRLKITGIFTGDEDTAYVGFEG